MEQDNFTNKIDFISKLETEPRILIVRVLEACNAGCFMCNFAFSKDSYRFSQDDAQRLAIVIGNSKIKVVRLTGGEPLILPDLPDILSILKKENVLTSIITNGFYLPDRVSTLAGGILNQVIVSIDGSNSTKHDRYRKLPGLYSKICEGLQLLQHTSPSTIIRVNTVVGKHNLKDLKEIYDNLLKLGVRQWSIIPLKRNDSAWGELSVDELVHEFENFKQHVKENPGKLKFLGYSLNWAGRDGDEIRRNWKEKRPMTPRKSCSLVDLVRYYTPKEGVVFPCNCVPHRTDGAELATDWSQESVLSSGLRQPRTWLKKFGPSHCLGCEPINAALGEGAIDLHANPLGF